MIMAFVAKIPGHVPEKTYKEYLVLELNRPYYDVLSDMVKWVEEAGEEFKALPGNTFCDMTKPREVESEDGKKLLVVTACFNANEWPCVNA